MSSPGRGALAALAFLLVATDPAGARLGGGGTYRSGGSRSSSSSYRSSSSSRSSSSYRSGSSARSSSGYRSSGSRSYGSGGPSTPMTDADFAVVLAIMGIAALFFGGIWLKESFEDWFGDGDGGSASPRVSVRTGADAPPGGNAFAGAAAPPTRSVARARLRGLDANFSWVVFVDFVHSLYVRFQHARGGKPWEPLRPFLAPRIQEALRRGELGGAMGLVGVEDVVIGSLAVTDLRTTAGEQRLTVRLKANLEERSARGRQTFALEEAWILARPPGTLSPAPEAARTLGCPACGAPVELGPQGSCAHCHQPVAARPFGWQLVERRELFRELLPPLEPGGAGVEVGTGIPTRFDPELSAGRRALADRHPGFSFPGLEARIREAFLSLQQAWMDQDEARLRAGESDLLFQTHRFWLARYREKGWRNRLADLAVEKVELVRVELDAHYETVTARIRARAKDSTVDAQGQVVLGDPHADRIFTEYWTLFRTPAAAARQARPAGGCPACGAPLDKVGQAGICGYCDARIVGGDFDWVLALIEQDEEYGG